MEERKRTNTLLEFFLFLLLIAAAVTFAWNISFKSKNIPKSNPVTVANKTKEASKWKEGKDLFKANCQSCHNPRVDGTGPALKGARDRWIAAGPYKGKTGRQWLNDWVKNYTDPVNAGYKYAVDMANSRASQMNIFPYLNDADIEQIFQFIDSGSVTADPKIIMP